MKHRRLEIAMPILISLALVISACGDGHATAQSRQQIEFKQKSLNFPDVIDGVPVAPDSAPNTYRMNVVKPAQVKESCTLTAVGPRVLLTAAHCVFDTDPSFAVTQINLGGKNLAISCRHLPQYQTVRLGSFGWEVDSSAPFDMSADVALCRVDTIYGAGQYLPSAAPYEWIDTSDENNWLGKSVIIAGFGPTSNEVASSGNQLSAGVVTVDQSSTRPKAVRVSETNAYADCGVPSLLTCAKHMLILSDDKVQLATSDSGGPVFFVSGATDSLNTIMRLPSVRSIIAVNKARLGNASGQRYSLVAALGNKRFRDWAVAWAAAQGQPGAPLKICGVTVSKSDPACGPSSPSVIYQ